ncbi:MAG: glycosyltransferase [Bacteroidetes bacterium]|nr:MAG: glycosyltransferase [Bacteroidota bacterium]
MDISVIIPLYNEQESLKELTEWIRKVMSEHNFSYEIIFIDDGSTDNSWEVIEQLQKSYPEVKGVKFRRNYGKSAALNTGFNMAKGDVVITMDADLQDSPDEIPELYKMIKEQHYHIVSGWKKKRFDPLSKTLPTKLFNKVTSWVSGIKLHDFNCGLKAYDQAVVKSIEVYGEMHRYIPVIAKWAGFNRITEKVVAHRPRKYGQSKFGIERFINGFLDLLSITFVSRFQKKPMHFFGTLGTLFFLLGGGVSVFLISQKIYRIHHHLPVRDVVDQPLFYIALTIMIIGAQLFLAGFLGELVSRSSSDRNNYLIEKIIGDETS